MKIKSIKENDKNIFKELSKEFYASGATINPYNDETNEKRSDTLLRRITTCLVISSYLTTETARGIPCSRRIGATKRAAKSLSLTNCTSKRVSSARIRKTLYQLGGKPLQRTRRRNDARSAVRQRARNRLVFGVGVCARRLHDNDKKNIKASDGKSFLCFRH